MKQIPLGDSGVMVSELCLGSMTWGSQNSVEEAAQQIERALDAGCNFIDTAEMYPTTPRRAETTGRTEEFIGAWLGQPGNREKVVIASKVTGDNGGWIRDGAGFNGTNIIEACEDSLKRLKTDVIDLYQLHWAVRGTYAFRQMWSFDPSHNRREDVTAHMDDVMAGLIKLRDQGKIRAFGLSNESAWGAMQWNAAAERADGMRVAAVQNEYSLLHRQFDTDWSEVSHYENIPLLAYSPLATGLLTGKYQGGAVPEGSRADVNNGLGGRTTDRVPGAVQAYLDLAAREGLDPVHLALAFCRSRPFVTIPIFGATTMEQLDRALSAADVVLSDEVLKEIDALHRAHPFPF